MSPYVAETWRNRLSGKAESTLVLSEDFLAPFVGQKMDTRAGNKETFPQPSFRDRHMIQIWPLMEPTSLTMEIGPKDRYRIKADPV